MADEQRDIAEDLRDREIIRECQLRVWTLHRDGYSFYAIRNLLLDASNEEARGHSTQTLWKWYQQTQKAVETEEDRRKEGEPRMGETLKINGEVDFHVDEIVLCIVGGKRQYGGIRVANIGRQRGSYGSQKSKLEPEDEEYAESA